MSNSIPRRRGLLIVDHGTRVPSANEKFAAFAERVAEQRPEWLVCAAHMELAEPGFAAGIEALISDGASEIHVHLHFLSDGFHIRESIPVLIAHARERHPQIEISVSDPLGEDPRLIEIVVARMDARKK